MSGVSAPGRRTALALLGVAAVVVAAGCGSTDGPPLGAAGGNGGVAVRAASVGEGERIAAGYLVLEGGDVPDRLVGASSPSAAAVRLHRTEASGAMVATESVAVPPGGEVAFLPGGDHLMFEGLSEPLTPGRTVAIDLEFAEAGTLRVDAPVVALVDVLDVYDGGW